MTSQQIQDGGHEKTCPLPTVYPSTPASPHSPPPSTPAAYIPPLSTADSFQLNRVHWAVTRRLDLTDVVCDCVQNAARLITWRQIHKVLGMDKLSYKEMSSRSRHSAPAAQTDADAGESADKQNGAATDRTSDHQSLSLSFYRHSVNAEWNDIDVCSERVTNRTVKLTCWRINRNLKKIMSLKILTKTWRKDRQQWCNCKWRCARHENMTQRQTAMV